MFKFYLAFLTLTHLYIGDTLCQAIVHTPLFESEVPIPLKINASIKYTKSKTNDSTYIINYLFFKGSEGHEDSILSNLRVRGNFRLKMCYFPPLKIKIKPDDVKGTPFEGNTHLKLVLPCLNTSTKNTLILKEYLCYQFYEIITPFHFKTRLTNLDLTETLKNKQRTYQLLGFFVEDNQLVAERNGGMVMKDLKLHHKYFDDLNTIRHDFFQFMIGNVSAVP